MRVLKRRRKETNEALRYYDFIMFGTALQRGKKRVVRGQISAFWEKCHVDSDGECHKQDEDEHCPLTWCKPRWGFPDIPLGYYTNFLIC